ncbi:hypothetical protein [Bradyrhizobium sp. LTSPM299]|uniref:hypothetical protein n=1 Tax=Bradyrhizobium sp. LTSPM299 TaxID=1619233 RepID=UPI000678B3B0|nr:hypothetical protein [Bradyrhizobium sp. LTSPM299]
MAAVALMCLSVAAPALLADEIERHEPEIDVFALMTGKCRTLKVADRDFQYTTVAFSHSPGGRSDFTVPFNACAPLKAEPVIHRRRPPSAS